MTAANFDACLAVTLAEEGGFVDDPHDPGGATSLGVTLNTWSGWIGHPATIAEIEALTPADVSPLYKADYFTPAGCNEWVPGVDLVVFDFAVNAGVGRAIRTLQTAVSVQPDGLIGPATRAAVAASNAPQLIARYSQSREAYYRSLPTFPRFGNGWIARTERVADKATAMAA